MSLNTYPLEVTISPLFKFMKVVKPYEYDVQGIDYFILDIDDTLIPWVAIQAMALKAMVACLVYEARIPQEEIMQEMREIFGRAGTLDYDRVFQELECLKGLNRKLNKKVGPDVAYEKMQDITHRARTRHNLIRERQNAKLFPHIKRLLKQLPRNSNKMELSHTIPARNYRFI